MYMCCGLAPTTLALHWGGCHVDRASPSRGLPPVAAPGAGGPALRFSHPNTPPHSSKGRGLLRRATPHAWVLPPFQCNATYRYMYRSGMTAWPSAGGAWPSAGLWNAKEEVSISRMKETSEFRARGFPMGYIYVHGSGCGRGCCWGNILLQLCIHVHVYMYSPNSYTCTCTYGVSPVYQRYLYCLIWPTTTELPR